MPEGEEKEELERQISQVEAHLAWLKSLRTSEESPPQPPETEPTPERESSAQQDPEDTHFDFEIQPSDPSELQRMRLGCWVFFAFLIGGTVFFFFGLPHLI